MINGADAFWAVSAVLLPPFAARVGMRRLDAARTIGWSRLLLVSSFGAVLGCALHILALEIGGEEAVSSPVSIALIGLLAVSGYVDSRSAWAPSELIVPICLMSGMASSVAESLGSLIGLLTGFALWLAARIAWRVQIGAGRPWLPPADLVAMVLPILLFGASGISAACFAALMILLGLARFNRLLDLLPGDPKALDEAAVGRGFGNRKPVALLGLAAPVLIAAMLADLAPGLLQPGN